MVFKAATFHGLAPEVEIDHFTRAALETAVANALAAAGGIDASDVTVTVVGDGEVVLAGTVGTLAEIERATTVARSVDRVETVRNDVLVG
ncbi:BON domain-containing protein [Rhizobium sp. BK251]|uniref:BON domain-containing protein n=1 Tax=Rhizobium sp. BK251 TaxID=2512125 RepID=UPI001049F724|nr:BON domain-containing protein [Rhizobium sp. BK251]TCL72705.1 BON domain-containing protein [Rhizobium sp. BK251]